MANEPTINEGMQKFTEQVLHNTEGQKAIGEQTERFWHAEEEFVDELQQYFDGWCNRRKDAAHLAIEFGKTLESGAENGEIVKAWSDLWTSAMTRFNEDAQAQLKLTQKFVSTMAPNSLTMAIPMFGTNTAPQKQKAPARSSGSSKTQ